MIVVRRPKLDSQSMAWQTSLEHILMGLVSTMGEGMAGMDQKS